MLAITSPLIFVASMLTYFVCYCAKNFSENLYPGEDSEKAEAVTLTLNSGDPNPPSKVKTELVPFSILPPTAAPVVADVPPTINWKPSPPLTNRKSASETFSNWFLGCNSAIFIVAINPFYSKEFN
jgi:hypothetical protein